MKNRIRRLLEPRHDASVYHNERRGFFGFYLGVASAIGFDAVASQPYWGGLAVGGVMAVLYAYKAERADQVGNALRNLQRAVGQ